MASTFAAGTLIVLGTLITVLGFISAGSYVWVAIGLLAVLAGGMLSLAAERRRRG